MKGKNTQLTLRALAILLALAWFVGLGLIISSAGRQGSNVPMAGMLLFYAGCYGGPVVAALLSKSLGAGHGCLWSVLALFVPGFALPVMAFSRLHLSRPPDTAGLQKTNNVAGLITALHCREPGYVRANAARALGALGSGEVVEQLLAELGATESWARAAAAYAIGHIAARPNGASLCARAVEPLLVALGDADPDARAAAATALGRIGDPHATGALVGMLCDREPFVRRMAAQALGRAGDAQAAASLVQGLGDPAPEVRRQAALALGRLCDGTIPAALCAPAVAALTDRLRDEDDSVRKYTVESLDLIRGPQATEPLVALPADPTAGARTEARLKVRGGFGEPYCSQECRDRGGAYISALMLKNQTGICGVCQRPVQASLHGAATCALVPYEGINLFVCDRCTARGKAHLQNYQKCCLCQKPL